MTDTETEPMAYTTAENRIAAAWDQAQDAFGAMLEARVYGLPDHPLTRAYTAAERYLDALIAAEQANVEATARNVVVRPKRDEPWPDLALGDHHVGIGR